MKFKALLSVLCAAAMLMAAIAPANAVSTEQEKEYVHTQVCGHLALSGQTADEDGKIIEGADTDTEEWIYTPHEHEYVVVESVEPTCEEWGYLTTKCDGCSTTKKVDLPPKSHSFIAEMDFENRLEGYVMRTCQTCGKRVKLPLERPTDTDKSDTDTSTEKPSDTDTEADTDTSTDYPTQEEVQETRSVYYHYPTENDTIIESLSQLPHDVCCTYYDPTRTGDGESKIRTAGHSWNSDCEYIQWVKWTSGGWPEEWIPRPDITYSDYMQGLYEGRKGYGSTIEPGGTFQAGVPIDVPCGSPTLTAYSCRICGRTVFLKTGMQTHQFDFGTAAPEASCEEPGLVIYTCQKCGVQHAEYLPPLDHDYNYKHEFIDENGEPTDSGSAVKYRQQCGRCEKILDGTVVIGVKAVADVTGDYGFLPKDMTVKATDERGRDIFASCGLDEYSENAYILDLPAGKYTVTLSQEGFKTRTLTLYSTGKYQLFKGIIVSESGNERGDGYEDDILGTPPDDTDPKPGDIDGDGEVTSNDALDILRASAGVSQLTPEQKQLADIDGDGEITSNDALSVLRYSVGLADENSPINKPISA